MSDIKINITGLSELLAQVKRLPKDVQEEIDAEILDSVFKINGEQRRKAPKDQGGLTRGIGFERKSAESESHFNIYSNSEHTGYMEFGTRYRVSVPSELTAIANQMRGAGIKSKLKAKEAIYAWCKRKGIPKSGWYAIFLAIMTVGVIPHPFFFQPFFDEREKLLNRIRKIVDSHSSTKGITVIRQGEFNTPFKLVTI